MSRERVVALVDMDCFYVQVEQRLNPSYLGKPCAVVQYVDTWKGGGILAVGYEARKFGVTRRMRGDEAKEKCPDIILARVPELRGKADLTRYRDAGAEVIDVLQTFSDICERASVDEAYLDLTDTVEKELKKITLEELVDKTLACSHIVGYTEKTETDSHDIRGQWLAALSDERNRYLAMGAVIVKQARDAVKEKTGFTCSGGIAHNKVLAKIAGGSHKPNQQTLLPQDSVPKFFETIPIRKVRFFGGKFGQSVVDLLHVEFMSELTKYSQGELQRYFGEKSGSWLYDVCRGREYEIVRPRQLSKSCGCGKNFPGKSKLISKEKIRYWMFQLASELSDRLKIEAEKNHRVAKLVSAGLRTETNASGVRSFPLRSSDPQSICHNAMQVIQSFNSENTGDKWHPGVTSLYLNASKFEDISKSSGTSSIASFFAKKENTQGKQEQPRSEETNELELGNVKLPSTKGTETIGNLKLSNERNNEIDAGIKTPSNTCLDTSTTDNLEPAGVSYVRDDIDQAIMDELPDEIRNEIKQFLGIPKTVERNKRTSNGIEKYTISRNSFCTNETNSTEATDNMTESNQNDLKTSGNAGFSRCSKCGEQVAKSKMDEHTDFHFALDLQKRGEIVLNSLQTEEPPKKRQKGSISNFFVPKER